MCEYTEETFDVWCPDTKHDKHKKKYNNVTNKKVNKKINLCVLCRRGCKNCKEKQIKNLSMSMKYYLARKYRNYTPECYCKECIKEDTLNNR